MSFSTQLLGFAIGFLYASFFEWILHKHIMHTPKRIPYAFKAHDRVHHNVFGFKKNYHLQEKKDEHLVTFAWWNFPLLLGINLPIMFGIQWLLGIPVLLGMASALIGYYISYEYLHYCYHVPKSRWFEKLKIYQSVKEHHLMHHKFKLKNLNVVFPIADFVLRTRIKRANPRDDDMLVLEK